MPHDQVIIAPWTDEEGIALRKFIPADVPLIRLTGQVPTDHFDDAYFARMKQIGLTGFSVNWLNLTQAFTDAAHAHGMKVYAWTINDAPDIAGAALLGVDGVITDDAANTMKLLAELRPTK
jgi:glycerophosphoryl diester phosphodiesterase